MVENLGIRISAFLALGASLASGILIFAFDFFGAYFGGGVYVYIGAGYGDEGMGIAAGVLMIISALLALITIAIPDRLNRKIMIMGVIFPLIVFILGLAGLGIAYDRFDGYDWWPKAGFFGSVIPSFIAFVFFLIIFVKIGRK